jgi:hypothetical protein
MASLIGLMAVTWGNYQFVLRNPGGNNFIPRWAGARIFMTQGISPYAAQAGREIQDIVMGSEVGSAEDRMDYPDPFYAFIVYAPFALISNMEWARAIWMTVLEVGVILIAVLSIFLSKWRIPKYISVMVVVFAVTWFYSVYSIMDGNVAILCTLAITASFLAIRSEFDVLAGSLLAIACIKPQIALLLILFIIIWSISHRRWLIIWSFVGGIVLLIALATLLLPGWFMQFLRQIIPYLEEFQFITPGSLLSIPLPGIGKQLGWALSAAMVLVLLVEWRAALRKNFRWCLWTAYLTLVIAILVGIPSSIFNFVVLLPVIILVLVTIGNRWGNVGRVLMISSMAVLSFGFWGLYLNRMSNGNDLQEDVLLYILPPLITLLGLYWVRWWAVNKQRLPLQEFADRLVE